jgi:hypothetical protein
MLRGKGMEVVEEVDIEPFRKAVAPDGPAMTLKCGSGLPANASGCTQNQRDPRG